MRNSHSLVDGAVSVKSLINAIKTTKKQIDATPKTDEFSLVLEHRMSLERLVYNIANGYYEDDGSFDRRAFVESCGYKFDSHLNDLANDQYKDYQVNPEQYE